MYPIRINEKVLFEIKDVRGNNKHVASFSMWGTHTSPKNVSDPSDKVTIDTLGLSEKIFMFL